MGTTDGRLPGIRRDIKTEEGITRDWQAKIRAAIAAGKPDSEVKPLREGRDRSQQRKTNLEWQVKRMEAGLE